MGPTHMLLIDDNQIIALGYEGYFSWLIEYDCEEWELATIYGQRQGCFKSFADVLQKIEYKDNGRKELYETYTIRVN